MPIPLARARHTEAESLASFLDRDEGGAGQRRLARDLIAATRSGSLVLHYQPRLTLTGGRVVATEAMLRWPHRTRGLIPLATFLPLAERLGLIEEISAWMLTAACREAAGWPGEVRLAVNIAARQVSGGALAKQVAGALQESGLAPGRLELELAEGLPLHTDIEGLLALSALRDLGIGLTLDHFGAAGGSLTALKHLPLTAVKLDRTLVRDLPGDRENRGILRAIGSLAACLSLEVLAEGVDSEAQRASLAASGCNSGQGYLFSGPLPAEQFRAWLAPLSGQIESRAAQRPSLHLIE